MSELRNRLLEEIKWYEQRLLSVSNKMFVINDIESEFNKRFNSEFDIYNDIVWHMYNDYIDMLIIDLTSITKKLCSKNGLIAHLVNYKSLLHVTGKDKIIIPSGPKDSNKSFQISMNKSFVNETQKEQINYLNQLFPNYAIKGEVTLEDLNYLKNLVSLKSTNIIKYRNMHSAHKYEHNTKGSLSTLEFTEINDYIIFLQEFLNKIQLISNLSSTSYTNCNYKNSQIAAEELVTLITKQEYEIN